MAKVSATATCRLRADYIRIKKDPVPYITAEPLPSNILEWHYIVEGPEDSPYEGGFYHGRLIFPMEYPFRPPSIYMDTPSGRFKTNSRLCLSISDFHPDTWNPAWSVSTILTGLLSFMLEKSRTFGSIESTTAEKQTFAINSWQYNLDNKVVCELFPEVIEVIKKKQREHNEKISARICAARKAVAETNERKEGAKGGLVNGPTASYSLTIFTNVAVITGFAVFAWLVRAIVINLQES